MAKTDKKRIIIRDPVSPESDEAKEISLSFLEYRDQDLVFHPKHVKNKEYIEKFANKFRHICSLTRSRLALETDKHTHSINWDNIRRKPKNYRDIVNPQLERGYEWWQISVTQGAKNTGHGRLIGFFKGNTYFLVWFDPLHAANPRK